MGVARVAAPLPPHVAPDHTPELVRGHPSPDVLPRPLFRGVHVDKAQPLLKILEVGAVRRLRAAQGRRRGRAGRPSRRLRCL